MSKIETGGPAFPFLTWQNPQGFMIGSLHEGMTIRDHFAGLALAGLYASRDLQMATLHDAGGLGQGNFEDVMAEQAYRQADAMLAARGGDRD